MANISAVVLSGFDNPFAIEHIRCLYETLRKLMFEQLIYNLKEDVFTFCLYSLFISVHGGWSSWHTWSSCSNTCSIGTQSRHRSCDNPIPQLTGNHCFGDNVDFRSCFIKSCAGNLIIFPTLTTDRFGGVEVRAMTSG